ncbi:MAG: aldo/keto reductase [Actinobacteria bacterium BACL15 MAG-120619-bin91]|jgi:aryl-alcohol dehydrogenase-like predicted oxidoreductase|uniref:Aldo/keto reductase n=2 Tax=ac1 cluster TaxID=1655545 RepID=A0A0R2PE84_9ACTN|nr:MAG: aldo/keto reductase [Actinobacteria bacterium BACL15 MAG-120619-bin91]
MELRRAGNSGLTLSRLGLGTMTWGRDTDEIEAADQCRAFLDAGGNFLDTAATYGDGDSERVIGGLIGTLFNRDEVIIATKAGITFSDGARKVDSSRHCLIAELDRSLSRLGTDFVDIWQIHAWDELVPLDDTLSALDYAYTTGRARYVGVSNYTGWQLARAATKQQANSMKAPLTTIQGEYSLLNRNAEFEIIDAAVECGVGFLAWAPLARGVLTGKYRKGIPSDSRGAAPHFAKHIEPYLDSRSSKIVEAVAVAAEGLGFSPLEVALAWVRDAPGVTSSLIGARTGAQLRGVLKSEEISLPEILRTALDEISL